MLPRILVALFSVAAIACVLLSPAPGSAQTVMSRLDKGQYWIGHADDPPGTLRLPNGVGIAPDGGILVADSQNHRVQHVATDGTDAVLNVIGFAGTGAGQLNGPVDAAAAPGGDVFVADFGNGRIQRFSPSGVALGAWTADVSPGPAPWRPSGVAVAPDGTVVVAGQRDNRIRRFTPDGRETAAWGGPGSGDGQLNQPNGLAVGADGTVYVADTGNARIQVFGPDGTFLRAWGSLGAGPGQLNQPWDVAVHPDGTVWVSDALNNRLQHFSAAGEALGTAGQAGTGPGELDVPAGLAAMADGTLVVVDSGNARVQRLATDGRALWAWGSAFERPQLIDEVAAAPDGTLYLRDGQRGRLWHFTGDGRPLLMWGRTGAGDGEFRFQTGRHGLAVGTDGTVFVADYYNGRVQRFGPDGTYIGQFAVAGAAPDGKGTPSGLAVAPDGELWVSEGATNELRRYRADGTLVATRGGRGEMPGRFLGIGAVEVGPDGTVYVADNSGVMQRFDAAGGFLRRLGSVWQPNCPPGEGIGIRYGFAVAPDGTLYGTASEPGIVHVAADGTPLGRFGAGGTWLSRAAGSRALAMLGPDRLIAAESFGHTPHLVVLGPAYAARWRVETFANRWLGGWPAAVHDVAEPVVDWQWGAPAPGLPADGWSARFMRVISVGDGLQRFRVTARGGARLWVDDRLVIDEWNAAAVDASADLRLAAGDYTVRLGYNDPGGDAKVALDIAAQDAVAPSPTPSPTPRPTWTAYPTPTATRPNTPNPRTTPWPTPLPHSVYLPMTAAETGLSDPAPAPLPFVPIAGIDVEHYDIDLTLDALPPTAVDVVARVRVRALADLDRVDLHIEPEALKVRGVVVDGRPRTHAIVRGRGNAYGLSGARLRTALGRGIAIGEAVTLEVRYALDPNAFAGTRGLMYREIDADKLLYVRGLPYYAPYWLPANNTPADAATATFALHVPPHLVAAANGALDGGDYVNGSGVDAAGRRTFTWRQAEPIAAYLMAVAIGTFAVHHEDVCMSPDSDARAACDDPPRPDARRVPLVWYRPAASTPTVNPSTLAVLRNAVEAAVFYSRRLGPYTYAKFGFFSAPLPYSSEYASLVAISTSGGGYGDALHELMHAWWGDAVRLPHWGDFWVKESLTTYCEGYWGELKSGVFGDRSSLLRPCDTNPMRGPADTDPMAGFIDEIQTGRRSNSAPYFVGASAWHDLRYRLAAAAGRDIWDTRSRDAWLGLLAALYQSHRGRTLSTDEIVAFLRSHAADAIRAGGGDPPPGAADALVDAWAARWLGEGG